MASPESANGRPDAAALHKRLADEMAARGYFRTARVEAAFRAVPRHLFVPDAPLERAYSDEVIITKIIEGQGVSSSSQPAIMAIMLEQLDVQPGQRVLEIGAGTGYNAALLAHLVGAGGQIITVDIDQDIVDAARQHLAAAGYEWVQVVCGDGGLGYADAAPYDRIILTVGVWDITPAWREQLKPDGRLVLPISLVNPGGVQVSAAFVPVGNGLVSVDAAPCGFMALRGAFAKSVPYQRLALSDEPGLLLIGEDVSGLDAAAVYGLLTGPYRDVPTGVQVTMADIGGSFAFRLALLWALRAEAENAPFRLCNIVAREAWATRGIVPNVYAFGPDTVVTAGLLSNTTLALLRLPPEESPPYEEPAEIGVRQYGPDDSLTQRLVDMVQQWDWAGRPAAKDVHIHVHPLDAAVTLAAGESLIRKEWHQHVLSWSPPDF